MDGRPLEGETEPQPDGSDGNPGKDRRMWGKCPENLQRLHLFFFWSRKELSASDLCEKKKQKTSYFFFVYISSSINAYTQVKRSD